MNTFIALFRGINVGGRNLLPMKELAAIMEECGHSDIRTWIQSGNVVFRSGTVSTSEIADLIEVKKGFRPGIFVLSVSELEAALGNNPFKTAEGKACHFFFCMHQPESVDEERLNQLKSGTEEYALKRNVFYLHAPDGIGRSKLAAQVERAKEVIRSEAFFDGPTGFGTGFSP